MNPQLRALLLANDEQCAYEFPCEFDPSRSEENARKLDAALKQSGIETRFEDSQYNQDASFGLAIVLVSAVRKTGTAVVERTIRISNFGNMASVTFADEVPEEVMQATISLICQHGYIYIPMVDLDVPYDGLNAPSEVFPTWWVRFFDWLW
ncbi:hypothetical protein [Rubinisphaera brasiliensis]|nr:hypothetical protein [Rubinisphaera brasiliensis]